MITKVRFLYAVALFFVGTDLIFCNIGNTISSGMVSHKNENEVEDTTIMSRSTNPLDPAMDRVLSKPTDIHQSDSNHPNSVQLSSKFFSSDIIDLLSPEIFSQSNPMVYFLEKTAKLSDRKVLEVKNKLYDLLSFNTDKFPERYLPYAKVLSNLLRCQYHLKDVKRNIGNMRTSTTQDDSTRPLADSPMISELLSTDILSDDRPPFHLIIRLTNFPENKINDLKMEMKQLFIRNKIPDGYSTYFRELWSFLFNESDIKRLIRSISELRDVITSKSPAIDSQFSKNIQVGNQYGPKYYRYTNPL